MAEHFPDNNEHMNFLIKGGEMGELIRRFDWSATPVGNAAQWPQSLKTTLSIILHSKFPMFLWWGKELICFYNDAYRPSLGNQGKHPGILGRKAVEAWPEIWDFLQPLIGQVLAGESVYQEEQLVPIFRNGRMEDVYWTFGYSPVFDEGNEVAGVLVTCTETTEKVRNMERLTLYSKRFQSMLEQAPVAIATFIGPEFVIELYNDKVLEFWGRTADQVVGLPLFQALPEAAGQGFEELLTNVYRTGERLVADALPVTLTRNGRLEQTWINFIYEALQDDDGVIYGILVVCNEITGQVLARQAAEQAESKLRLAIDSSELGTWYIDAVTREFIPSPRLKEIFGFSQSEEMPYEAALAQITDDYREYVRKAVEDTIVKGDSFALEYTIKRKKDKQLTWVRATGKLYPSEGLNPANFAGTMIDITDRKLEEQRKDDFISIASHELKTPTTSLKATLQLMDRLKDAPDQKILPNLITQANRSVQKLASLIEELLNSSRANSGSITLKKNTFTIAEMLEECCSHVRMAGKHQLILTGDKQLQIFADEHQIDQVVVNLVNNAVKYAPDSKEIILNIEKVDQFAKISVRDSGRGIPAEKLPHLFQRYYQVQDQGAQNAGLGLGLYISSEIIKRHGGSIGVESEPGKGSTFWFTLPLN